MKPNSYFKVNKIGEQPNFFFYNSLNNESRNQALKEAKLDQEKRNKSVISCWLTDSDAPKIGVCERET